MEHPLVAEVETLIAQINAEFDDVVPDPDQFDWPEPRADELDDPLYDSTRDYVVQVDRFREHQGKNADVRLVRDRVVTKTCTECGNPFPSTNPNQTVCGPICANKRGYRVRVERSRHAKQAGTCDG